MALKNWSTTAASNILANTGINWDEGMAAAAVNNSARSTMAQVKEWYDQIDGGTISNGTVGGTASAITLTNSPTVAALAAGQRYTFALGSSITGATTLAVDGLTAKNIYWQGAALVSGMYSTGDVLSLIYDGTQFQVIGPFPRFHPTSLGIGGAATYRLDLTGTASIAQRTAAINAVPVVYLPDQTSFLQSFALGNGLRSLSHAASVEGYYNTGVGILALEDLTTGYGNTAVGSGAGKNINTGFDNTFVGYEAGQGVTDGYNNCGVAPKTLYTCTSGYRNVALGTTALFQLTTGFQNVMVGVDAGYAFTTGANSTGVGYQAFLAQTAANGNTGIGYQVGKNITTGIYNTLLGFQTGNGIVTGDYNTIVGAQVTGLSSSLSNRVILADGQGNQVFSAVGTTLAVTIPGAMTVSGQLIGKGTATNDNAASGNIGEVVSSEVLIASKVALTTGTAADVASISLTAGDWEVYGNVAFDGAGALYTVLRAWINDTSATQPTVPNKGALQVIIDGTGDTASGHCLATGTRRISVNATTTVYLGTRCTFTTANLYAYGYIEARRVR